jgi:hypothetical protein
MFKCPFCDLKETSDLQSRNTHIIVEHPELIDTDLKDGVWHYWKPKVASCYINSCTDPRD